MLCVLVVASGSPACHLGKPRHQLGDGDLEYSSDSKVFAKKGFKKGHLKLYPYGLIVKCSSPEKDTAKCLIEPESGAWFVVQPPKVDFATGMLVPFFWVGYTSTQSEATMEMSRGKLHKLSMPVIKNTSALKAGQQLLRYKPPVQQGQKRERERDTDLIAQKHAEARVQTRVGILQSASTRIEDLEKAPRIREKNRSCRVCMK